MNFFLDTDTCIYYLKGMYPLIREKLDSKKPMDVKIHAIVKAELLFGAENSQRVKENKQKAANFLFPFEIVPFDSSAAEVYASIRYELQKAGKPIGGNDLIIASTVLATNSVLVTNNEKEFKRIPKLKIDNWVR